MAFEAHKKGLYTLSNSQIEKHIQQNPKAPDLDYAFLLSAVNYIQLKEYNKAIIKLNFLKNNYPDSPFLKDALSYLALAYLKTKDINSAVSSYRDYKKKFGENVFIEKQIEEFLLQLAISLFNEGKISESRDMFNLFVEEFKSSQYLPIVLYYQGVICYKENNFISAKDLLSRALKGSASIDNRDIVADIQLKLADSLLNLRDYEQATGLYKNIIQNFPDTIYKTWASFQLAIIEKRKENLNQAEVLLSGIKGSGDKEMNFRILSELAQIKMLKEDWSSAEKQFAEILAMFPEHKDIAEVYMQLGFVNFNMNRFEEAITFFNKSLEMASDVKIRERSYFGLGYAYYARDDISESFKVWNKLASEFPTSAFIKEILFLKGKKLYEKRDYVGSEKHLEKFILDFQDSALYRNALTMLIESLLEQKKFGKARRLCEDFLSSNRDDLVSFLYGKTLYLSKDFEKGKNILKGLEAKNPAILVESTYYLGKIYEYEGNKEQAQEKFLEIITFYRNFPEWVKMAESAMEKL